MSIKEEVLNYLDENPFASTSDIAKTFNRHESSIRALLSQKVRDRKTEYNRNRRRELKNILVSEKGGKCSKCGYNKYSEVLEFHHTNPEEKDFNVTNNVRSLTKLRKEAEKCILLCPNCHREIHIELKF